MTDDHRLIYGDEAPANTFTAEARYDRAAWLAAERRHLIEKQESDEAPILRELQRLGDRLEEIRAGYDSKIQHLGGLVEAWHKRAYREGEVDSLTIQFPNGCWSTIYGSAAVPKVDDEEALQGWIAERGLEDKLLPKKPAPALTLAKGELNKLVEPSKDLSKLEPGTVVPAVYTDRGTGEVITVPGISYTVAERTWKDKR